MITWVGVGVQCLCPYQVTQPICTNANLFLTSFHTLIQHHVYTHFRRNVSCVIYLPVNLMVSLSSMNSYQTATSYEQSIKLIKSCGPLTLEPWNKEVISINLQFGNFLCKVKVNGFHVTRENIQSCTCDSHILFK